MAEYGISLLGFTRSALRPAPLELEPSWWQVRIGGHDLEYWYYIENGTINPPREPRPFIAPTVTLLTQVKMAQFIQREDTLPEAVEAAAKWLADEWRKRVPVDTGALQDSIVAERII